jgi:hypothetical protein
MTRPHITLFVSLALAAVFSGCGDESPTLLLDTGTVEDALTTDAGAPDAGAKTCRTNADCETTDTCRTGVCDQATERCTYTIDAEFCYISDVCYAAGDEDPENACRECAPDTTTDDFTYLTGKSGWTNQVTQVDENTSVNECVDPCIQYCDAINTACTGDLLAQYIDAVDSTPTQEQQTNLDSCNEYCANWQDIPPSGNPTSSNSIECRLANALEAQKSPNDALLLCPIAGPTGGDQCGTWCDNYCQLGMRNCPNEPAFTNLDTCLLECATLNADGKAGDTSGDTVQCRIHYLGIVAIASKGSSNCNNGNPGTTETCSDETVEPGDTCAAPLAVESVPFFASNTTKDSQSAYRECIEAGSSGIDSAGSDSPDHIWLINGPSIWGGTTGTATLTVTITPSFSASAYLLEGTCSTGELTCTTPKTAVSSDVSAEDEITPTPIVLSFTMDTTTSKWLVIDGLTTPTDEAGTDTTAAVSGPYTIKVEAGPTCDSYCATITAACTGAFSQYTDEASCLEWCNTRTEMAAGETQDTYGNTIGCRLWHAVSANSVASQLNYCTGTTTTISTLEASLESACQAAGPSGGGVCGTDCDVYCDLYMATCTGATGGYTDRDECVSACDAMPAGLSGATAGNSVQCRITTLAQAVLPAEPTTETLAECLTTGSSPTSGCTDTCAGDCTNKTCGTDACGASCGTCSGGQTCNSAGACVGDCARYCHLLNCHCSGGGFASETECVAACEGGDNGAMSNDQVDCLSHHAALAKTVSNHCAFASGEEAVSACSNFCNDYCELAISRCTGTDELFADKATCTTACENLNVGAGTSSYDVSHVDEDTVQCRIDYLTAIDTTSSDSPSAACSAAAITSTVCVTQ